MLMFFLGGVSDFAGIFVLRVDRIYLRGSFFYL